jgi:hypothetical protein
VIGTVILFGFLILALSLYQVQIVPQQNAQTEFEHFEEVQNDLVELRNGILSAGSSERPQFVDVKLGTNFQTRLFAINPPDPGGTLRTSPEYNITIDDNSGTVVNVSTRFIEYRPEYRELQTGPIWYENSVLYLDERDSGSRAVIIEEQNLVVDNDTLRITAVQNEFRASGTRRVALELYPADNAANLSELSGSLDVTIPTRLGEDDGYWNESIESGPITYVGVNDAGYSEEDVSALRLRVDSPDNITVNSVGVQSEPSEGAVRDNVGLAGGGGGTDGSDGGATDGSDGGETYDIVSIQSSAAGTGNNINVEVDISTTDSAAEVEVRSLKDGDEEGSTRVLVENNQPQTVTVKGANQADEIQVILYSGDGSVVDQLNAPYP